MIMTDKEKSDYDKLSPQKKELYAFYKKSHPNWSHNQIMMRVAVDDVLDNPAGPVNGKGQDVEPTPEFLREVLSHAKDFLRRSNIYIEEVYRALNSAIERLTELINRGIRYLGSILGDILKELFS